MGALAIAQLIESLLPGMIALYNQIRAANAASQLKPVEEILATADANWDSVIATAQAELDKLNPPPAA